MEWDFERTCVVCHQVVNAGLQINIACRNVYFFVELETDTLHRREHIGFKVYRYSFADRV